MQEYVRAVPGTGGFWLMTGICKQLLVKHLKPGFLGKLGFGFFFLADYGERLHPLVSSPPTPEPLGQSQPTLAGR